MENEPPNQSKNTEKGDQMHEHFEPFSLEEYEQMTDAEYEVAMSLAATIGLAKRFGPTDEEISELPLYKRILVRRLPQDQRWKYSPFAHAIRDWGLE